MKQNLEIVLKVIVIIILVELNESIDSSEQGSILREKRSPQYYNWPPPPPSHDNQREPPPDGRQSSSQQQQFGYRNEEKSLAPNKPWASSSNSEFWRTPRDDNSRPPPPSGQYDRPPPPPPSGQYDRPPPPPPSGQYDRPPPPPPPPDHYGRPPQYHYRRPHDDYHRPPPHDYYNRHPPHDDYYRPPPPYGHYGRPPPPPPDHYGRPPPRFDSYDRPPPPPPPPPPHWTNGWHQPPPDGGRSPQQDKSTSYDDFSSMKKSPNDNIPQNKYFPPQANDTQPTPPTLFKEEDLIRYIEFIFRNQNIATTPANSESINKNSNTEILSNLQSSKDTDIEHKIVFELNNDPKSVQSTENPYIFDLRDGFGLESINDQNTHVNRDTTNDQASVHSSPSINKPFIVPLFQAVPVTPKSY